MKRHTTEEIKEFQSGSSWESLQSLDSFDGRVALEADSIITQLLAERERDTELLKEAFAKLDTASSMMVASPRCVAGVKSTLDNLAERLKGE